MEVRPMIDIILCLIGMILQAVFIIKEHKQNYKAAVILKGSASFVFVLLGLHAWLLCHSAFSRLIFLGLIFGAIGDVLLNLRFVLDKIGSKVFLAGIASFLIGHVLYLCAMIPLSQSPLECLIAGILVSAALLYWILNTVSAKKAFKIFGVFYIGAVVLMTSFAVGNYLSSASVGSCLCAVGAVLFTLSDIILIFNTFTGTTRFSMRIANLSLYYLGQLLIALCAQLL